MNRVLKMDTFYVTTIIEMAMDMETRRIDDGRKQIIYYYNQIEKNEIEYLSNITSDQITFRNITRLCIDLDKTKGKDINESDHKKFLIIGSEKYFPQSETYRIANVVIEYGGKYDIEKYNLIFNERRTEMVGEHTFSCMDMRKENRIQYKNYTARTQSGVILPVSRTRKLIVNNKEITIDIEYPLQFHIAKQGGATIASVESSKKIEIDKNYQHMFTYKIILDMMKKSNVDQIDAYKKKHIEVFNIEKNWVKWRVRSIKARYNILPSVMKVDNIIDIRDSDEYMYYLQLEQDKKSKTDHFEQIKAGMQKMIAHSRVVRMTKKLLKLLQSKLTSIMIKINDFISRVVEVIADLFSSDEEKNKRTNIETWYKHRDGK